LENRTIFFSFQMMKPKETAIILKFFLISFSSVGNETKVSGETAGTSSATKIRKTESSRRKDPTSKK